MNFSMSDNRDDCTYVAGICEFTQITVTETILEMNWLCGNIELF